MKTAELKGTVRTEVGKKSANQLRGEDKVPAVLYGSHGNQHIYVDYIPLEKLTHSPHIYLINLDIDGKETRVIIQDIQFHPITDRMVHIDFLEAEVGKKAKLDIPVNIIGNSKGVLAGGNLVVKMRRLRVIGVPAELPETIDVDITELMIGKSIKVGDLAGYEFLDAPNSVIVRVKAARNMADLEPDLEEGDEEALAEGEVAEGGEAPAAAEGEEAPKAEAAAE